MLATPVNIGEDLRAERERLGLSVAEIAKVLHVQPRFLSLIEAGETPGEDSALPSVGYVLGYVRAYADHLGLSGELAVERYKTDMAIPKHLRLRDMPHIVTRRRRSWPRGMVSALSVVLAAAAFASYSSLQARPAQTLTPAIVATPVSAPDRLAADRLTLTAETASWIRVVSGEGEVLATLILKPGQSIDIPQDRNARLDVRDAGAVRLGYGGRDLGHLGTDGQTLRGYDPSLRLREARASGSDITAIN